MGVLYICSSVTSSFLMNSSSGAHAIPDVILSHPHTLEVTFPCSVILEAVKSPFS